ncbi:MAG: DUF4258 domain-containing protein [Selenomonadaceae bacterium]|nr:DUF4258 domain-containing protein [Selenomonadaceae bacterium]
MIELKTLQAYFESDSVFVSDHAAKRFRERGLRIRDVRNAVQSGEIIEQYPDDYPYPSCLILGTSSNGEKIHVVMSDEGTASRIITAYFPDKDKWSDDFRTRREISK